MVPLSPSRYVNWATKSALELFHAGLDTHQIADYWGISEAEAERRVSVERSNFKGLPDPYEAQA
jgi:hypothetical protein